MRADVCVMSPAGRCVAVLLPIILVVLVRESSLFPGGKHARKVNGGLPRARVHGSHLRQDTRLPHLSCPSAESKRRPMHARWAVRLAMTVLAAAAGGVPHADIYSFVDAAGVTHFSNVPVDNRYRLPLATRFEERRVGEG